MKKIIPILILFCISFTSNGFADTYMFNQNTADNQVINIKGRVIDKKTQEAIPYVNIAIIGIPLGTITNKDGYFDLKIPGQLEDKEISISAIGYQMLKIKTAMIY